MSYEEKFMTFSLGKEEYGIPISKVKEIIEILDITPVPKTAEFVKGVINLRGKILPVIDLRQRFHMEAREYDKTTCILVVETLQGSTQRFLGIIVDSVSEVITLEDSQIGDAPVYNEVKNKYISNVAKIKDRVIILLDINDIFTSEDVLTA